MHEMRLNTICKPFQDRSTVLLLDCKLYIFRALFDTRVKHGEKRRNNSQDDSPSGTNRKAI